MSCDDSFPVFLLYNWGKLTGFGWAMIADVQNTRVEHPTKKEIPVRMNISRFAAKTRLV
jgi:charged multivesicular body protein 7